MSRRLKTWGSLLSLVAIATLVVVVVDPTGNRLRDQRLDQFASIDVFDIQSELTHARLTGVITIGTQHMDPSGSKITISGKLISVLADKVCGSYRASAYYAGRIVKPDQLEIEARITPSLLPSFDEAARQFLDVAKYRRAIQDPNTSSAKLDGRTWLVSAKPNGEKELRCTWTPPYEPLRYDKQVASLIKTLTAKNEPGVSLFARRFLKSSFSLEKGVSDDWGDITSWRRYGRATTTWILSGNDVVGKYKVSTVTDEHTGDDLTKIRGEWKVGSQKLLREDIWPLCVNMVPAIKSPVRIMFDERGWPSMTVTYPKRYPMNAWISSHQSQAGRGQSF